MNLFILVPKLNEVRILFLNADPSSRQLVAKTDHIIAIIIDLFSLLVRTVVFDKVGVYFIFGD